MRHVLALACVLAVSACGQEDNDGPGLLPDAARVRPDARHPAADAAPTDAGSTSADAVPADAMPSASCEDVAAYYCDKYLNGCHWSEPQEPSAWGDCTDGIRSACGTTDETLSTCLDAITDIDCGVMTVNDLPASCL